ncbi:hypothetical protein ACSFA8_27145 [Variovorax sp. RT4R15]|uniref:hypothetical protein n=1 Tax=Variovorax sp. RT4R15 TaxID=3443737 RepID=UPI003F479925
MSDLAASVRARLLNVARAQDVDFTQVLVRYALELPELSGTQLHAELKRRGVKTASVAALNVLSETQRRSDPRDLR